MHVLVVSAGAPDRASRTLIDASAAIMRKLGHTVDVDDIIESGMTTVIESLPHPPPPHRDDKNYLPDDVSSSRGVLLDPRTTARIEAERARIEAADFVILHIPFTIIHAREAFVWSIPNIPMKRWLDVIVAEGFSGNFGRIYANGGLRGRIVFVIVTTDDRIDAYPSEEMREEQADRMLHPILHGTLYYCGMDVLRAFIQYEASILTTDELDECIDELTECLEATYDDDFLYRYEPPIGAE